MDTGERGGHIVRSLVDFQPAVRIGRYSHEVVRRCGVRNTDKLRSGLYLDFDNLFSALYASDPETALRFAQSPGDWAARLASRADSDTPRWYAVRRCYMNPSGSVPDPTGVGRLYFSRFRALYVAAGFEVVDCPPLTRAMKNAADIRIALDIVDLIRSVDSVDEIILASSDSDFTPLLSRLRMRGIATLVVTGGQTARAYVSVADRYLDESEFSDLINGTDDDQAIDLPADEAAGATSDGALLQWPAPTNPDLEQLVADFRSFARELLANSSGAVNLAHVGMRARERFGRLINDTRWFGLATQGNALGDEFHVSGDWLYDPERVDPANLGPYGQPSSRSAIEVLAVEQVVDIPHLSSEAWPRLFATLETYAATHSFNLTECTAWTRDQLAEEHTPVGRAAVGWVVRGAMYGGAPLTADPSPTAEQIAIAVFRNSVRLAHQAGVDLGPQEREQFARHLGLSSAPEDDHSPGA